MNLGVSLGLARLDPVEAAERVTVRTTHSPAHDGSALMRGTDQQPGWMFNYLSRSERVPPDHFAARDSPDHRSHPRAALAAPRNPLCSTSRPTPFRASQPLKVRRRDRLGGLLHEYE